MLTFSSFMNILFLMKSDVLKKLLKYLRKNSLHKLSLEVGISYATLWRIYNGVGDAGCDKIEKLERYLNENL